jgi:hypothetical protein
MGKAEGLLVRACGDLSVVVVEELEDLQGLVGGYVGGYELTPPGEQNPLMTVYWNEDGKMMRNVQVNWIMTKFLQFGGVIDEEDVIVGDCVVLGPANEEGEDTCLTPHAENLIRLGALQINEQVQKIYDKEFNRIVKRIMHPASATMKPKKRKGGKNK